MLGTRLAWDIHRGGKRSCIGSMFISAVKSSIFRGIAIGGCNGDGNTICRTIVQFSLKLFYTNKNLLLASHRRNFNRCWLERGFGTNAGCPLPLTLYLSCPRNILRSCARLAWT